MSAVAHTTQVNDLDTPTADPNEKRLATITAQLALAGQQVHKLDNGFLVHRWGMSRHCPDLDALQAFGRVLGVMQ